MQALALRLEFRYFQFKRRSESEGRMLEQKANEMFGDEDPTGFGTGEWRPTDDSRSG